MVALVRRRKVTLGISWREGLVVALVGRHNIVVLGVSRTELIVNLGIRWRERLVALVGRPNILGVSRREGLVALVGRSIIDLGVRRRGWIVLVVMQWRMRGRTGLWIGWVNGHDLGLCRAIWPYWIPCHGLRLVRTI